MLTLPLSSCDVYSIEVTRLQVQERVALISGQVDRASVTEAVDSSSIPSRVKPKTIKIGSHSFPA